MQDRPIIVAGHACLDLIPALPAGVSMTPGTLTRVGPAQIATGGAVPNVGVALHRLGVAARLVGTIGDVGAFFQDADAEAYASCFAKRPDATGGVPTIAALDARIAAGWRRSEKWLM